MFQQSPAQADESDVQEERRTANSHASNNQSKHRYWHSIGMPCPLLPCVRKVIHRRSEVLGTQNRKQSKRQEQCRHHERCGYIPTTGNCCVHTSEMYHRAKSMSAIWGCFAKHQSRLGSSVTLLRVLSVSLERGWSFYVQRVFRPPADLFVGMVEVLTDGLLVFA